MRKLYRLYWEWRGVLLMVPSAAVLVLALRLIGLLQAWEWATYDLYMRVRPPELPDDRIVIVGVTEGDIQALQQATINDGVYAEVIQKLLAMNPRAIGLDIYRYPPIEPGSAELERLFREVDNLVSIEKVIGDAERDMVAPHPVSVEQGRVGANDLVIDADNTIRRGLISVDRPDGTTVPSFGSYLALMYLDAEGVNPEPIADAANRWYLGQSIFKPFEAYDGGYVRAEDTGYQILLNYRGPTRSFETVSLMDILTDRVPPDWGRDRVVLIGGVGESFQDSFYVPYSSTLLSLPERMSGVEIHANLTSQIISAALDGRSLVKTWPEPLEVAWLVAWAAAGGVLAWPLRNQGSSWIILRQAGLLLGAGAGLVAVTFAAFVGGWWIPIIPPMLAYAGAAIAVTGFIAHTANDIRQTFGRYLSDEIVASLLEDPDGLKLGGERRRITILTSDLRGFTATSERLPPEEVIKILNFYLGAMADVITRYNGTIDEFMGDGILVLFGAPTAYGDEAERAIACAIDMQLSMMRVNKTIVDEWGLPPLEMGIGINTGEVVVGNIGSEKRSKYGIVGSQVNLTYRIESYTVGGQILISETTLAEAGDQVVVRLSKEVQPKGVIQPITIYDIVGIGAPFNLSLPVETEHFLPLEQPIPLQYVALSGKHLSDRQATGYITHLSAKAACIQRNGDSEGMNLEPLTNLKLNLRWEHSSEGVSEDVYAKVLELPAVPNSFYIRFTSKPPEVDAHLGKLYQCLQNLQ